MGNILLVVLLLLAIALTLVVLMQRSDGGGLGMGGGGDGGLPSGRASANTFTKLTWILGVGFMCASLALTIISAREVGGQSVIDRLGLPSDGAQADTATPSGEALLPPTLDENAPLVPQAE